MAFKSSTAATTVVGDLNMAWQIPVSVGGKLTDTGAVALTPSPDQFNGSIDNIILTLG